MTTVNEQIAILREALSMCITLPNGEQLFNVAMKEKALAISAAQPDPTPLKKTEVKWVVNSLAELGVKIGEQYFFLYKGASIVYTIDDEDHDDGVTRPLKVRPVGKREFGEVCMPWALRLPGAHFKEPYTEQIVTLTGEPAKDSVWYELPLASKDI